MITNNPPAIFSQPQSQAVNIGTTVMFSLGATGSGALYYQWLFDGVSITGATASSLTVPNAQPGKAGEVTSVIVSSPTGSTLSSNALLTVYAPPIITNQPVSQTCFAKGLFHGDI